MIDILIATVDTPQARNAVRLGAALAALIATRTTLLTVIRDESERVRAQALLAAAAGVVGHNGSGPLAIVRVGQPVEQIVAEVARGNYDLLLLGERDQHGLIRSLLGTTSERVLQHVTCPVLVARGEPRPPRRLLLCEGGRDPSLLSRLLARLAPLVARAEALTVLHVMSQIAAGPGVPGWELEADAGALIARHTHEGELLQEDLSRLQALNLHLEAKVRHGLVVSEIQAEANSGAYDLLVIGAHRGEKWERFLLDDLARQIINQVRLPVLVI